MSEEQEKNKYAARYEAALHAVQSATAFRIARGDTIASPKHMRVGIDSTKAEMGGLATLLIEKGIFTELEYFRAMALAMEREKELNEKELGVKLK